MASNTMVKCGNLQQSQIDPEKKEYGFSVPEVVQMVPLGLSCALDVGCSAGGLGYYLKTELGFNHIIGIEYSKPAAEKASRILDHVFIGDACSIQLPDEYHRYFDIIIYADVLEHLYDPWHLIQQHKRYLKKNGYMLTSIPNIRNLFLILNLLRGRFDYSELGLLDRTHIRFFTADTAVEMFTRNGLELIDFRRSYRSGQWYVEMNAGNYTPMEIVRIYDLMYEKFISGKDCIPDIKSCFGLFDFTPDAVADLFTVQYHLLFKLPD